MVNESSTKKPDASCVVSGSNLDTLSVCSVLRDNETVRVTPPPSFCSPVTRLPMPPQMMNKVKLAVNLSCQGKGFNAVPNSMWVMSLVKLTVFSFSPDHSAKTFEKQLTFWPDRDSSNSTSLVFSNTEFGHYLYNEDGVQKLDLQLQFNTEINFNQFLDWKKCTNISPPKV